MLGIDLDLADGGFTEDLRIIATPAARGLSQLVLRTDISGMPLEWIDYRESARLYHQEQVAYTCGSVLYKLYGGMNARTGRRTVLEVNSIVATIGHTGNPGNTRHDYVPPLNNQTLFRRDAYICMYCGMRYATRELSRDHIRPFSQNGQDVTNQVVLSTVSVSATGITRSCRMRSTSSIGSSGPENAKQSSVSCAITRSASRRRRSTAAQHA